MSSDAGVCLACGARTDAAARFCSQCGRPLGGETGSMAYEQTQPRLFGVASPDAILAAACVFLVVAIVAFAVGGWLVGLVLLAPALVLLVFFYGAARRDRTSRIARTATRAGDRIRGWVRFARWSLGAWARAGRDVLRLRGESRALRRERGRVRLELGDAAYQEDEAAVTALRSRMHEIDEELGAIEQARAAALASARRHVEDERVAVRPTRELRVDETKPGENDG